MKPCPISFGDCPDCEFHREGECQHKGITLPWADKFRQIIGENSGPEDIINKFEQYATEQEEAINQRWNE